MNDLLSFDENLKNNLYYCKHSRWSPSSQQKKQTVTNFGDPRISSDYSVFHKFSSMKNSMKQWENCFNPETVLMIVMYLQENFFILLRTQYLPLIC